MIPFFNAMGQSNWIRDELPVSNAIRVAMEVSLNMARMFDPYAIIAGGCPRDIFFGKKVKDIDIYVNTRGYLPQHVIKGCLERIGFEVRKIRYGSKTLDDAGYKNPRIDFLVDAVVPGIDFPIQLVTLKPEYTTFNEVPLFDVNISQFWYNGKYILPDIGAREFIRNGVVKIRDGVDIDDPYVLKLKEKYSDFNWEV